MSLNAWFSDFSLRLQQLENIAKGTDYNDLEIWIGGLFSPEAYVTATRQAVAQRNQWSLEELVLEVDIGRSGDTDGFAITGMFVEKIMRGCMYNH